MSRAIHHSNKPTVYMHELRQYPFFGREHRGRGFKGIKSTVVGSFSIPASHVSHGGFEQLRPSEHSPSVALYYSPVWFFSFLSFLQITIEFFLSTCLPIISGVIAFGYFLCPFFRAGPRRYGSGIGTALSNLARIHYEYIPNDVCRTREAVNIGPRPLKREMWICSSINGHGGLGRVGVAGV